MFEKEDAERKGKPVQRNYLGLYGREGVGKTTICCEAMCNYYQEKFLGGFVV
jgi:chromosomal replication initiation ATPase DnaA